MLEPTAVNGDVIDVVDSNEEEVNYNEDNDDDDIGDVFVFILMLLQMFMLDDYCLHNHLGNDGSVVAEDEHTHNGVYI